MSRVYTVEMVSRISVEITADSPADAISNALMSYTQHEPDAIIWDDNQVLIHKCLGCDKHFLDTEDFTSDADSSDVFCEACSKDEEFQKSLKENGEDIE